jgi:hypothetical protein
MGDAAPPAHLVKALEDLFRRGVDERTSPERFNALALEVFAYQFAENVTFRGFCRRRGATPETVVRWQDVPAVPTTAFKHVELVCGDPSTAEATFLTSGTTSGPGARGRHRVPRLALYRAGALPNLQAHLNPEGSRLPVLSLIPSPADAPDSSLSVMMGFAAEAWGDPVWWLGTSGAGTDVPAFLRAAGEAVLLGGPVLVAGTAFAFVHLLDELARARTSFRMPEGSRIMETGGFKGRAREVERDHLYEALEERLGIPQARMVNEYGMTELLSQLYEPNLRPGYDGARRHVPPPWLAVRALDPTTLAPLGEGESGLLAFYDLANLGSVSHVLTQDLGSVSADGVRLRGRAMGAEPRGCSLALEDLLASPRGPT